MRFVKLLFKAFLIVFFLVASAFALSSYLVLFRYADLPEPEMADCALVFGAAIEPSGEASSILFDRVSSAVKLYQEGKVDCIVLSGAPSPFGVHETYAMKSLASKLGVRGEDLKTDFRGLNTCYSIKNLAKDKSYILISNSFHLARIAFLADKLQLSFQVYPAHESQGPYDKEVFFVFREIVANIYYRIFFDGTCENGLKWLSDRAYNFINSIN